MTFAHLQPSSLTACVGVLKTSRPCLHNDTLPEGPPYAVLCPRIRGSAYPHSKDLSYLSIRDGDLVSNLDGVIQKVEYDCSNYLIGDTTSECLFRLTNNDEIIFPLLPEPIPNQFPQPTGANAKHDVVFWSPLSDASYHSYIPSANIEEREHFKGSCLFQSKHVSGITHGSCCSDDAIRFDICSVLVDRGENFKHPGFFNPHHVGGILHGNCIFSCCSDDAIRKFGIPSAIVKETECVSRSPTSIELRDVGGITHDDYSCGGQRIVDERNHRSIWCFDQGKVSEQQTESVGETTVERYELGIHALHIHRTASLSAPDTFTRQLLGNASISNPHSISEITHDHLPCLGSRTQRDTEFFTSVRLVFELRQTCSPDKRKSDVHRTDPEGDPELGGRDTISSGGISRAEGQEWYGGRWCTVREEMDLQNLDEWIMFCDDYDIHFDEYLYPLLRNDIEDAIILGRKVVFGEPSKQLFLASFRSGLLCHLGEGDYTCQLKRLVKGHYYDNVITEANLSFFFPHK